MKKDLKYFMIDLDGTVYHRSNMLPYVKEFIEYLNSQEFPFLFFTNSPERNHQELSYKLKKIGLDVEENKFLSTADLVIDYINDQCTKPSNMISLYVIGNDSFKNSLKEKGYNLLSDNNIVADYVVVGFDQNLTFNICTTAYQHLSKGATLISTNQDTTIPTEYGMIPHTGPIVAFLEFASQKKAIDLGKPNLIALESVLKYFKCEKSQLCLVGDNLATDIKLGEKFDILTFLVYTGLTTKEMVKNIKLSNCVKDFDNLKSVVDYLKVEI